MLIVFQILAVLAIAVAALFMLRGGGARHQAIRRIMMMIFIIAAASSVFLPQVWTRLANLFGVARGADLLLYLLVLSFLGFVATTYRRFRSLEGQVTELARRMAIDHAERPEDRPASAQSDAPGAGGSIAEATACEVPVAEAPAIEMPTAGAPATDPGEGAAPGH